MTRRCCYCVPRHIIGPDQGPPYSDGLCWKAALREDIRWYAPKAARFIENAIVVLAAAYITWLVMGWQAVGFRIIGL